MAGLVNWFSVALVSGVLFGLSRVVGRVALRDKGNPLAYTAIHDLIAGLVMLPFLFFVFELPQGLTQWLLFFGIVIFFFLADYLAFVSLKKIDVSWYQIIGQTRHIFILFGGFFFFAESITLGKIIAISLIAAGVAVSSYKKGAFHWSTGAWWTLASTIAAVIAFLLVKPLVEEVSIVSITALEFFGIALVSFALLGGKWGKVKEEWRVNWKALLLGGSLFGFFELTLFEALRLGEVSRVIPVNQVSIVVAVLIGIFFLHEKERMSAKLFGTSLVILGLCVMYIV